MKEKFEKNIIKNIINTFLQNIELIRNKFEKFPWASKELEDSIIFELDQNFKNSIENLIWKDLYLIDSSVSYNLSYNEDNFLNEIINYYKDVHNIKIK